MRRTLIVLALVAMALPLTAAALAPVQPVAQVSNSVTIHSPIGAGAPFTSIFDLPVVVVKAGSSVTWRNADPVPHTVTDDLGGFNSGLIFPGGAYTRTFTSAGAVAYHCALHPWMNAVVVVTP